MDPVSFFHALSDWFPQKPQFLLADEICPCYNKMNKRVHGSGLSVDT